MERRSLEYFCMEDLNVVTELVAHQWERKAAQLLIGTAQNGSKEALIIE